jgi:L-lactate dehydrogenase complex protein LldG
VSSRSNILARVRAAAHGTLPEPASYQPPETAADWSRFAAVLEEVGGQAHGPVRTWELGARLADLARERARGGRILAEPSAAEALGRGPWEIPGAGTPPHSFEDVATAIVLGHAGVAECGAVAVRADDAPDRALPFLCRHLILLLPAQRIAADLHRGFALLPPSAWSGHHVTWISGPSKTSDIEQTLVFGAHGPLTLDVVGFSADAGASDPIDPD